MKLRSLQVTNFRCFESLTVEFDPQLTVLVANNGMGKTAILEATATGLGSFFSPLPNIPGRNPKETDFRIGEDGKKPPYMRIRLETTDGIAWDRTERRDKTPHTLKLIPDGFGVKAISQYSIDVFNKWLNFGKQLPLIAYYGTGRAVFDTPQTRRGFTDKLYINDAYQGALDAKPNFRRFFDCFYFLEDIERRGKEERRDWDFRSLELEIIREAISRMMPGFSNPHSKLRPLRFMVEWHHDNRQKTLRIDQLSDGFRTTLALVMDIASRLAVLAGFETHTVQQAINAEGIVLIDEIDLHLHPSWQQRILPDLLRTFPGIQFIVTTHSPQVLTTVTRASIRNLEINEEGLFVARTPSEETLGVESQAVLNGVMKVNPIPPVEAADWYADYIAKIENGCHNDEDGQALSEKLLRLYGPTHTVMRDADRLIRFQEFKLRKKVGSTE
ncbi:MAG: AAA family ATPase [Candidatus Methylumidiphilus sp.]